MRRRGAGCHQPATPRYPTAPDPEAEGTSTSVTVRRRLAAVTIAAVVAAGCTYAGADDGPTVGLPVTFRLDDSALTPATWPSATVPPTTAPPATTPPFVAERAVAQGNGASLSWPHRVIAEITGGACTDVESWERESPPRGSSCWTETDALAVDCESGGRWGYSGPGYYDGGIQFDPGTWAGVQSRVWEKFGYWLPDYAYDATRPEQIAAGWELLTVTQSPETQWPDCTARSMWRPWAIPGWQ